MSTNGRLSITEDTELLIGATGAVYAEDQIIHSIESEDHKLTHALKAAIGAAVAVGAYELLRRDDKASSKHPHGQPQSKTRHKSDPLEPEHHHRHLAEEVLGAYALGKEMLGDRKHHISHLVEEAIGATGLFKELTARENEKSHRK
jgi:hypothetical protein